MLIEDGQTDKALELAKKVTDQSNLGIIATMLINQNQPDKAIKIAERITNKYVQIKILEQFVSRIHDAKDPKYGQVISAIYDLAAKQKNEETIKKLLPYTPKSNVANGFKDSLQFPTIEEISPPASNSDYVAQGYEKPTISQSNQQFIAQHDSQRTTMGDNPTLLKDPSYNVGFMDNLNLLRVGSYITQSAFNIVKDSWINMFGANANNDQVKEARKNSKIQFNSLKDPLMDIYKEIIEIYESKIKTHNNKSDKALYDEIAQLKQFKEQAEEIMKDLRESSQWSKEFKANLNENKVIKQARVELLEQKIIKISQTSEKFFEAIEKNRESSKALKKTSAQVEGSYYNAELANMLDKNPKARIAVPKESLDWPQITELDQNINFIPNNRSLLPDSKNKPIKSK